MKKYLKITLASILSVGMVSPIFGGNPQRAGSAGATELLINPWARSSGWSGANSASITGVEAQFLNIAGTAFADGTDLVFSYTNWFADADIGISAFGFSQRVGDDGALSLAIMSMSFGDIEITTTEQPEGGIGTYSPQFLNIGLGYAKRFTENIYGGVTIKLVSESLPDLSATGMCFDAGVQYVTGAERQVKFGISIKNVGPTMAFDGDGLAFRITASNQNGSYPYTVQQRTQGFELPSLMHIGASYDFNMTDMRFTLAGNFTSNSFTKDQLILGAEWALKEMLMIRAAYAYEDGITSNAESTTIFSGFTGGASFEVPLNGSGESQFAIDYAYRHSSIGGINSIGAAIRF
jgi:hypothetical protein